MADMSCGLIAGRVVDRNRRPVADARVRLNFITCEPELNGGSLPVQSAGDVVLRNVDTDSKGLFRFFFQWKVLHLPYVMNIHKQGSLIATDGTRSANHRFLVVLGAGHPPRPVERPSDLPGPGSRWARDLGHVPHRRPDGRQRHRAPGFLDVPPGNVRPGRRRGRRHAAHVRAERRGAEKGTS